MAWASHRRSDTAKGSLKSHPCFEPRRSVSTWRRIRSWRKMLVFRKQAPAGEGASKGAALHYRAARAAWAGNPLAWMWDWTALNSANTTETWKRKQIFLLSHTEACSKADCQTSSLAFLLKPSRGIWFKHQCLLWQMGWHCNRISFT